MGEDNMAKYEISDKGIIEINFKGVIPHAEVRNKMKAVKFRWNPKSKLWWAQKNENTIAIANEIYGFAHFYNVKQAFSIKRKNIIQKNYALKIKIKNIRESTPDIFEKWKNELKDYVNDIMTKDNSDYDSRADSPSEEVIWIDCFNFLKRTIFANKNQQYELVFEYSLPGTVHERPDVFLLTDHKVISLEFKKKKLLRSIQTKMM